ncbi:hypothetical protein [Streptomyces sp. NPDC004629]
MSATAEAAQGKDATDPTPPTRSRSDAMFLTGLAIREPLPFPLVHRR